MEGNFVAKKKQELVATSELEVETSKAIEYNPVNWRQASNNCFGSGKRKKLDDEEEFIGCASRKRWKKKQARYCVNCDGVDTWKRMIEYYVPYGQDRVYVP